MRFAAPFLVPPFAAAALVLGLFAPRSAAAQTAAPHSPAQPLVEPPDGNWKPGATLPPRTPERNLFTAPPPVVHDSVADGAFYGALAGAGAMVAPSLLSRSRAPLLVGGLAGAAVGSVIDARHVTRGRRPAVVVLADREARALQLQWRF
jgi:hypothetical protein